jgi:hypothetical protein
MITSSEPGPVRVLAAVALEQARVAGPEQEAAAAGIVQAASARV